MSNVRGGTVHWFTVLLVPQNWAPLVIKILSHEAAPRGAALPLGLRLAEVRLRTLARAMPPWNSVILRCPPGVIPPDDLVW